MLNAFLAWAQKHWPIAVMFMGVDYLKANLFAGPIFNALPDPRIARAVVEGGTTYAKFAVVNSYDAMMY